MDIRFFCILFLAVAVISGIVGYGMNQKDFDEFNSTHTCFLNSSMQTGQECWNETIIDSSNMFLCMKECPVIHSEYIGNPYKMNGYLLVEQNETCLNKCREESLINITKCQLKPIRKCEEWTINGCGKQILVGIKENSNISDISMSLCDNQEKICTKWKYNFEVAK